MQIREDKKIWLPILAVALGYFIDLYDLLLFGSIRTESLKELNITGDLATAYTQSLMNYTVGGMVLGGFFWGWIADKKGRSSVLFASIITYTLANLFNAFISGVTSYQVCRFIAGFGLAGELGVGLTLVSELLPSGKRTNAGMIVTATGMLGAVFAGILSYLLKGRIIFGFSSWRFLFLLGAIMGLLLLIFRASINESEIFLDAKNSNKGKLKLLFGDPHRVKRFLFCFLAGLPVFFIIGNFVTLSPEYGKLEGINDIQSSISIIFCYLGLGLFDFIGTWFSKQLRSRKKVIYYFLCFQTLAAIFYLFIPVASYVVFYFKIFLLGSSIGLWGVLILNGIEQFGTNLRSTVATSIPNLIRGALVPLTILFFDPLKSLTNNLIMSGAIVVFSSIVIAFLVTRKLEDKFELSLNFQEQ